MPDSAAEPLIPNVVENRRVDGARAAEVDACGFESASGGADMYVDREGDLDQEQWEGEGEGEGEGEEEWGGGGGGGGGGGVDERALAAPGVFVWCLTLCAGISGLLFGFEYVFSVLLLSCECVLRGRVCGFWV